jgi:hypothetical protein
MIGGNDGKFPAFRDRLQTVFLALQKILQPYKNDLAIKHENTTTCYLETRVASLNGRRLFFAGAKIKRNYVSFYLAPLFFFPDLAYIISPDLRRQMQGQSCFNFTAVDPDCLDELTRLTESAFQKIKNERLLS